MAGKHQNARAAILRWDDDGELLDETLDASHQHAGCTVCKDQVLRATASPPPSRGPAKNPH
ncbi:hypothetical protein ACFYYM_38405 [Streptomyces erythrochromogenes]|uniref:hypothetical protein n=1 Tax=Streptomyces erythrochromogenes TaxID=285574 RepID=UPI0036A946DE